jgi:hypothetical protein
MTTRPQLTSADLVPTGQVVPTGQEQGTRGDTVAGMQQAGLPTSSVGTGTTGPAIPPASTGLGAGPTEPVPSFPPDYDVFANQQPSGLPPLPQGAVMRSRVEQSQNAVMHDLLARMDNVADG